MRCIAARQVAARQVAALTLSAQGLSEATSDVDRLPVLDSRCYRSRRSAHRCPGWRAHVGRTLRARSVRSPLAAIVATLFVDDGDRRPVGRGRRANATELRFRGEPRTWPWSSNRALGPGRGIRLPERQRSTRELCSDGRGCRPRAGNQSLRGPYRCGVRSPAVGYCTAPSDLPRRRVTRRAHTCSRRPIARRRAQDAQSAALQRSQPHRLARALGASRQKWGIRS